MHELTIEHETLKSRPPEVVTKEVTKIVEKIPADYESIKKMVSIYQTKCSELEIKLSSLETEHQNVHEDREVVKKHGKKHEEKSKYL